MLKRELRDAERVYVNCIPHNGLQSGNYKPFWQYVKSQNKKHMVSISALKSNSNMIIITDSLSKSDMLALNLNLFSLPFLEINFPSCRILNSPIVNHYILLKIVFSYYYIDKVDVSRPDNRSKRLPQCLVKEVTPVVHIFNQSLYTDKLHTEWTHAIVLYLFFLKAVS